MYWVLIYVVLAFGGDIETGHVDAFISERACIKAGERIIDNFTPIGIGAGGLTALYVCVKKRD